jgi:ABC-type transport system involved in Fe-S cluster assembly fused permease/ATPase subunit
MESMVMLMKTNAEIKDDPDAVDAAEIDRHSLSTAVPEHLRQVHVEFRDVHFSYTANVPVLSNISFRIFSGDSGSLIDVLSVLLIYILLSARNLFEPFVVAFVGSSGSGKSTIFRLLFRFYDVDSGSVSFLGTDVRKLRLQNLRSNIGVVPQDTVLFNDTIGFNIQCAPSTNALLYPFVSVFPHAHIEHRPPRQHFLSGTLNLTQLKKRSK